MNEKDYKIVQEVCNIFNIRFKHKYLAHNFLYYDKCEILIYSLTADIFYKLIIFEVTTQEQLLKDIESIILRGVR